MITGIHIFRKDLRLVDNFALYKLYKNVDRIILIFILDNKQIKTNEYNKYYKSNNSIQFMCESLEDLYHQSSGKLILFNGMVDKIINDIIKKIKVDFISFNADFTQYSLFRDDTIMDICNKNNIKTIVDYDDQTLVEMKELIKKDKTPYLIFGPFYKNESDFEINNPVKIKDDKYYKPKISFNYEFNIKDLDKLYTFNKYLSQTGGRLKALNKLKLIKKKQDTMFNTGLNISAYLNFGLISTREFYNKLKKHKDIIRQLYWRDFYLCILRYHPNGNSYSKFLDKRYNQIKWKKNKKDWEAMIDGKTGFLLIDAAMIELKMTGFISNRARLLLCEFWICYLLINPFDPEYGAQVGFSKYLVDCSTSQNKMNIQWVLSELDLPGRRFKYKKSHPLSGRMIRIDNEQIKKYDPDGLYIKKWLNLNLSIKDMIKYPTIFNWEERYGEYCSLFKTQALSGSKEIH